MELRAGNLVRRSSNDTFRKHGGTFRPLEMTSSWPLHICTFTIAMVVIVTRWFRYSVRIVCYSITSEGLDEQIYDPPGDNLPRATIRVCRKGDHVISTSPAKGITDIRSVFAPPTIGKPTKLMRKHLMEENLGLFDVPDEDEKEESEGFEDLSQNEESVQEDDEIVESSAYEIQRKVGAVYETQVRRKCMLLQLC